MTSWEDLKKAFQIRGFDEGHKNVTIAREGVHFFLTLLHHNFDEEYYLSNNPDVRTACDEKKISSAFDHYIHFGYYEGRFPGYRNFDPAEYIEMNHDLGFLKDLPDAHERAKEHYRLHGYREGRVARR